MNDDSRRLRRYRLPAAIQVSDAMTDAGFGRLCNISAGGMLLLTDRLLQEDCLYQLQFTLPQTAGHGEAFEPGAQVLWSEAANPTGQYWAGLRFIGLGEDASRRLDAWLAAQLPDAAGAAA